MRSAILWLVALTLFSACSGTRNPDDDAKMTPGKEKLIDALTLFVESVQGDRFDRALEYLTVEEKAKMIDASGTVPPPVQKQLKALRLSTLAAKPGVRLEKGKLAGISAWLPNIDRSAPATGAKDPPPPIFQ